MLLGKGNTQARETRKKGLKLRCETWEPVDGEILNGGMGIELLGGREKGRGGDKVG